MDELGYDFCIRIRFKSVASLLQKRFNVLVVRNDAIVHNNKWMSDIGPLWMWIHFAGYTVCCPSGVSDANMSFNWFITCFNFCVALNTTMIRCDNDNEQLNSLTFSNSFDKNINFTRSSYQCHVFTVNCIESNASWIISTIFLSFKSSN